MYLFETPGINFYFHLERKEIRFTWILAMILHKLFAVRAPWALRFQRRLDMLWASHIKSKTLCAVVAEEMRSRALCCILFPDVQSYTVCFKLINTKREMRKLFAVSCSRKVVIRNDKAKLASVNHNFFWWTFPLFSGFLLNVTSHMRV